MSTKLNFEKQPGTIHDIMNRGHEKVVLGRLEAAIADFKKAIRRNPNDAEGRHILFNIQSKLN